MARPSIREPSATWFLRVSCCVLLLSLADHVSAQCVSNASSCVTCHETEGRRPVLSEQSPWHLQHGFADLCAACHGGDPSATEALGAHAALQAPLSDPEHTCTPCHGKDGDRFARRYLAQSRPDRGQSRAAASPPPQLGGKPPPPNSNRALAGIASLLAVPLYFLLRRPSPRRNGGIVAWLRARSWSPYVAGTLLGLVVAISEVAYGRPVAVAGAFDKLSAYAGRALLPESQYYALVMSPGITWQVWVVVGIFLGAYASSKLSGSAGRRWLPDTQWQARFGSSRAVRLVIAFFGAALVQIGAGIAGGCTSGLAISGGAMLAPAAFLFMAGMFAAGMPTAWLWHRNRSDR